VGQGTFTSGQTNQGNDILAQVHEDMPVYDVNHNHIGKVRALFLGVGTREELERGEGSATAHDSNFHENNFIVDLARAFDTDEVPEPIRARLRRSGFIRLDADGIFSSDRYITPEQIASVDDHVHLNVTRESLIKR
jgi:hypothetical protein